MTKAMAILRADVRANGPEYVLEQVQAAARELLRTPGVRAESVDAAVEAALAEIFDA